MKKFFKVFLWTIIVLIFIGTFIYLFINSRDKDTVYEIVTPTKGTVERTTVLTGKIEPRDEIEIKPQVSGIISEINVEAGDLVKEGDIIAKIKVVPDEGQLASAKSRVRLAEMNLENLTATYNRTKSLYDKKFESRENFEKDRLAFDQAQEELEAAKDNLSIVQDGISTSNATSSNTLVRATISGLVLEVPVKVGSSVIQANTMNDGTTIAKVADMNDIIFNGKIDETEVAMLSEGMDVQITVGAISDGHLKAVIEKIAPMATEENGTNTFEIKAAINVEQDIKLRAGYSANATVILERENDALIIPERVIEFSGDSTFVFVLDNNEKGKQKFTRTLVETGISDGVNIAIKSSDISIESSIRGSKIN